ncbi:MAG: N-acetyltransferase [Clostridia bacterium]|nr:N-acetyltransferase [Clostridia bacterium]
MNTKSDILEIAKAQLALDYNYQLSDFEKKENIISENRLIKGRRIYNSDGCFFKAVCFGSKAMVSASPQILSWCQEKLAYRDGEWFFEYPKLRAIDKKLNEFGHEIADLHHYYLPDPSIQGMKLINDIKWYEYEDIKQFKDDDRFGEAFAFDKNHRQELVQMEKPCGKLVLTFCLHIAAGALEQT